MVCPVCGHANIRSPDASLNWCAGCFRDSRSGELHYNQVIVAVAFLFGAFLFAGLTGALAAIVLVQVPLEVLLGFDAPSAVGGIVGFGSGLWLAEWLRAREVAIPQPVPAWIHPERRIDKRVARVLAVAVLAFVVIWWMDAGGR